MASRDYNKLKNGFYNSGSAKRLAALNYKKDIDLCCKKNITDNVAISENNELKLIKD